MPSSYDMSSSVICRNRQIANGHTAEQSAEAVDDVKGGVMSMVGRPWSKGVDVLLGSNTREFQASQLHEKCVGEAPEGICAARWEEYSRGQWPSTVPRERTMQQKTRRP